MAAPEQFQNPTPDQRLAIQVYNDALGILAVAFHVSPDDLNELAGSQTENAILWLQESSAG